MGLAFDVYAAASPNGTLLATLTDALGKSISIERNAPGSGVFSISRSSSQATAAIIAQGNLVKVRLTELGSTPVFAFWMETGRFDLVSSNESGAEVLTFGGKGAFAYAARAILWSAAYVVGQPQPVSGSWLLSTGVGGAKAGAILRWVIDEVLAGARPQSPLPSLTTDFSATLDSAGNAWATTAGTVGMKAAVGTYYDDLIAQIAAAGGMAVEMAPNLLLHAWNSRGTDRTSVSFASTKVRLEKGTNIATALARDIAAGRIPSHALVSGDNGAYGTASNSVTPIRETFVAGSGDATALTALATQALNLLGINADAVRAGVPYGNLPLQGSYLPGPPNVGGHFWIDDTITLHTGTAAFDYNQSAQKVAGITIGENPGGDPIVEVALGSTYDASVYGAIAQTIADLKAASRNNTSVVASRVDTLATSAPFDVLAPNTPTGLALVTGYEIGADGGLIPSLTASWNANAESDLDGYAGEVAEALQGEITYSISASGSGGALTAGAYNVAVTGIGADGGEGKASTAKQITITAGQRIFVNITALTGMASYKVYVSRSGLLPPQTSGQTTATTGSNVEATPEGTGAVPPLISSAVRFLDPVTFRTARTSITLTALKGGRWYAVRIQAVDHTGNRSAFTTPVGVRVAPDSSAPAIPTGLAAASGFRLLGVRWAPNTEADLGPYELRWSPESTDPMIGLGVPDPGAWISVQVAGTSAIIDDLVADINYFVQVRAIDTSGNVRTSLTDSTAVPAATNPDAGWSNTGGGADPYVFAAPSTIGAADFAADSIIANIIAAGSIDAGTITTGTLSVGGTPGIPDFLLVYSNSGVEIGRWDANGLLIKDPANTYRQMRLLNGVLSFSNDNGVTWLTAINADGIDATRITFGSAGGGHNTIPNASLELSAFTTLFAKIWTVTGDWAGTFGTPVNLDTSGSDLKLTTFAYIGAAGSQNASLALTGTGKISETGQVTSPSSLEDTFSRVTTAGWGVATSGVVWTGVDTPANLATDGNIGVMTLAAAATAEASYGKSYFDSDVTMVFGLDKVPVAGRVSAYLRSRRTDASNFYQAFVWFNTDGSINLGINKTVAGTSTNIVTNTISPRESQLAGRWYNIRLLTQGSTISAKVWQVGTSEPVSWDATATDTALTAAGTASCRGFVAGTATGGPYSIWWDSLNVVDLGGGSGGGGAVYTFQDEFDGSGLNSTSKIHGVLTPAWGFNYRPSGSVTKDDTKTSQPNDSNLHFTATKVSGVWHSSSVDTKLTFQQLYGIFEARIKIPKGRGLWPAGPWGYHDANAMEIDGMEILANPVGTVDANHDVRALHCTVHYTSSGQDGTAIQTGVDLSLAYHTYGFIWRANRLDWTLDGAIVKTVTDPAHIPNVALPIILDLGAGGSWAGEPDSTTPDPSVMLIDWVHVQA